MSQSVSHSASLSFSQLLSDSSILEGRVGLSLWTSDNFTGDGSGGIPSDAMLGKTKCNIHGLGNSH